MSFPVSVLLLSMLGFTLSDKCIDCICTLESSGCNLIGCNLDAGSLSCGPFQIKLPYYEDCGEPWRQGGEILEDAWKRCANIKECAIQCILRYSVEHFQNYVNRYRINCPGRSECETTARLHIGGPNGCKGSGTDWYWAKMRECMGETKNGNFSR